MKKLLISFLTGAFLLAGNFSAKAQLTVDNTPTAIDLAQILAGPNITILTASLTGDAVASGSFDGSTSNIGMNSGVILSTGDVANAPGPNNSAGGGDNLGEAGTAQMDGLAGATSFDAITLEFSFEVQSDFIQFQYVFASEEYPEYAPPNSSAYNDVFAFYISGPGIVGEENIALVPTTTNPVTINNINAITNNAYYVDNTGGATVQYDAFTTVLTAEKQSLTPCETYTMKLVIADGGDAVWNSAVFLLENSFIQGTVGVNTSTVNADDIALEGCIPAQFNFSLDVPSATDTPIIYQIGGTATNGIDYSFIDTMVTIPAGDTTASIIINSISDGVPEGTETIFIIYQPDLCSPVDTAFLYIDDAQPIEFTTDGTDLSCFGDNTGEINVNATGGFPPYTYYVTTDAGAGTTSQYTSLPVTGLVAGTYSVQVYDIYGCKAEALVIGGMYDADTTFLPDGNGDTYTTAIPISGFGTGATLDNMSQLQQICATMEHSYLGDLEIKIVAPSGEEVILKQYPGGGSCDLGEPFASGPVDGSNSTLTDPGVGFEYCWNATPIYGTMVDESGNFTHTIPASTSGTYTDNYLPQGSYESFENLDGLLGATLDGSWTLEVTDNLNLDNGYIFNWNISLVSDLPDTLVTIGEPNEIAVSGFVSQANCGGSDGAIDISVNGDFAPFTYAWSSGQTTEDISGIPAGTYTVYVTDDNGCTDSATYILNNISSMNITTNIVDVTCSGGTDGSIDLSTSGGTAPYSWSWSGGQTSEDISSISAGTHTITITDDNGCVFSDDVVVSTLPDITISLNSSLNEVCSADNGAIDIDVTGGSGSYGFSWDNGATTEDLTAIGAGTYNVTVTDANGCTGNNGFSIINDVSNCSAFCFLNIVTETVVDENCGDGTGSIDVTVMDATNPYITSWSTGATSDDISGLNVGTYTITVIDANQCEVTEDIVVNNTSGTLAISANSVSNENCGNDDGSIDITVVGGTAPYTFAWSNAATTEDISGLSAGTYDVTITDNAGCTINGSYTVGNNTGTLSENAIVSNEVCGNNGGSINLTPTGGIAPLSYLWSNGATSQDVSSLVAGDYSVVITDAVGCELTSATYTVSNDAGSLSILSTSIVNEICGDASGSIDIEMLGGTTPYTYLWNTADVTEDITGLSEGTYDCTITDDNGCSVSTGTINLFNEAGTLSASTNSITDEVCGDGTGQIDINTVGGVGPFTYSWDSGQTTEDLTGLSAGTYILTITDDNGCVFAYNENVGNASPGFMVNSTIVTDETCGDGTGGINVTTTGGSAPISYSWNNGATTEDLTNVNAGSYNLTITDNNGCELTTSGTVNGGGIDISSVVVSDEICGDMSGSIDITFTGGVSPFTFAWDNGGTTEDQTGLAAGTYNLDITDDNGCTANGSYVVGNNTNGLSVVSTVITDENCGDGAGAIDVTISGGTMPVSYDWDNGATSEDLSGLSGGVYNVIIEDDNGCTVTTGGTVVNISGGFTVTLGSVTDENCGDGAGSIDIDVTGGSAPYTFAWDSGQTTEDLTGLSAGDYTVTVTDNTGCSAVLMVTVDNITGTLALANEVIGDANCMTSTGFIDLTISGGSTPYTFAWSNGATTEDISGLDAGTFTCVITDNAGCVLNYSGDVNNTGGAITTDVTIENEDCGSGNGSIIVEVTGGISPFTYSWTGGATPSSCCDYTLDMQDQGNSWNGASITVLLDGTSIGDFTVPGGGANIETFEVCDGQSIELVWNPGGFDNEVSFDFYDADGTLIFSQGGDPTPGSLFTSTGSCPSGANNISEVNGLSAGTYDLTITDNVGCEITESYTILDVNTVQIDITSITDDFCSQNDGEIIYTVSGATNPWTTTANGFTDGGVIGTLSNLYADTWEIITTDANGCIDTAYAVVNNTASFTTSTVITDETCGDLTGAVDLTLAGGGPGYTFDWDNGATTEDLSGLAAGTYVCTIIDTDNGDCEDEVIVVINNSVDFTSSAVVVDESCGDASGSIDQTITGSTDLTFAWSNGASTEDLTGLSNGDYTCTIINNTTGCSDEVTYTISNVTTGMVVTANTTPEDCGNADGEIDLTVTGGVGAFTFDWDTGDTSEDLTGLTSGFYTVTVTDQNDGCEHTEIFEVGSDGFFNVDVISSTDETCGQADGSIDIDANGPGTGGATFDWSNGATTEDINGLSEGTYTCIVTNAWGCEISVDVDIVNNTDITVASAYTDEVCGGSNGSIDLTVAGSTDLSFDWDNGATTEDLTDLAAGTYTCTVTNNTTGCEEVVVVTLVNDNTPDITLTGVATDEDCGDGTGTVDITVVGSTDLTFDWDNGATTEDLTGLNAGTYTVIVTNNLSNCQATEMYTVNNITNGMDVTGVVTDDLCNSSTGEIDVTVTGGVGPFSYSWDNGATTEDITGLGAGTYELTVTDDSDGCEFVISFDVNNTDNFTVTGTITNSSCATCTTGAIDVTINEIVPDAPYTFSWSNGETTEDITGLMPGTYTLTVTGASGCHVIIDFVVGDNDDVSIDNNGSEWLIEVYPNPARNNVTIAYNFYNDDNVIMNMTNMLGEIVRSEQIVTSDGIIEMDIKSLQSGVYFINLTNGETTQTIKFVISR